MRKYIIGLLIFMAGWGAGRYSYLYRGVDPEPSAQTVRSVPLNPAGPEKSAAALAPAAPGQLDDIVRLLQRNEFDAVLGRYESLRIRASDAVLADATTHILSRASELIAAHRFVLAEQLLQLYLTADYRDVEARMLLAEAYRGQQELQAAIDQLYEARGYAWRPAMLARITGRIRTMVAELTGSLRRNDDQTALQALYQRLIQLEPDHAPWFMELAAAQLALDDKQAARRSLLLVAQDPDVGAQAQSMLAGLSIALVGIQDAATGIAAIPLHRNGNHFIVDARPAQGRNLRLLIDTGASLTIFTPAALEQAGTRYQDTGRTGVFNTANGPVEATIYQLDSLAVGGWQVEHLEIGVLDLGSSSGVDGLLGMNFLNHFQFFIDQNKALLRLTAN